ncbi:DUF3087 domain-containing protein [Colwellia sp. D2M02]|uniref:DUF3087 family protein n=1 Tax=Colwellia sp. D2M02 TaxID=2841562 RepID=UPI001C096511|nr:DUF3087 family protein [Colwellia sp. D2M02]MBU2892529.1 DUF3087 domain-containing protein [Colwellia sp. D2M02]
MQLKDIDKARYKKHLNIVIVGFISSLLILSLIFGQLLIALFSTVEQNVIDLAKITAEQAPEGSNFKFNLIGVVLALFVNAAILHRVKNSDFFNEVYYVWQIKQVQNLIYRKLKKIKAAAKESDEQALRILFYYYNSIKQLYILDDNTITLSSVEKNLQDITESINEKNIDIDALPFDKAMLADYK